MATIRATAGVDQLPTVDGTGPPRGCRRTIVVGVDASIGIAVTTWAADRLLAASPWSGEHLGFRGRLDVGRPLERPLLSYVVDVKEKRQEHRPQNDALRQVGDIVIQVELDHVDSNEDSAVHGERQANQSASPGTKARC